MRADLLERVRAMRLEDEIAHRGIKLRRQGSELIGPCPRCGGTDRFGVHLKKQVFNCRRCGACGGDAIALVQFLQDCSFAAAVERLVGDEPRSAASVPIRHQADADVSRIRSALRLWREAGPIEGTLGITYLEREREIFDLPPDVHEVLRFHRRCVCGHDPAGHKLFYPAVIALFRDVLTNEPTGIHRIALDCDANLIGRMALGRKQGAAVKLWPDEEVSTGLVIGEGIETTLAAATRVHHRGTLLRPAWSLVDASNLERFPIIAGIDYLTVLADADANDCGQRAARTCAKRWAEAGRQASVLIPDKLGQDFNDIAKRRREVRS